MYGVYDMKNYEQCIGIFDKRKDVSNFFDIPVNILAIQISRKQLIENRYMVVKIEEEE